MPCLFCCLENTISVQDTIVVVPPYPYSIEDDPADVPLAGKLLKHHRNEACVRE